MEPSLVLLSRALTVFFLLAAASNIALVALQKSYTEEYVYTALSVAAATARQLAVEKCVHHTHVLTLMAARLLPFTAEQRNATLNELRGFAADVASTHRELMSHAAAHNSALPSEISAYSSNALLETSLSFVSNDGTPILATSLTSLSNLGLDFASQVNIVAATQPLDNITAS